MPDITIYRARRILTMNPSRPEATHVAVRDGRILGAGPLDELTAWGAHALDERFAKQVLMPGLVEGHSHVAEGSMWSFVYCGYFDRTDPDGKIWPGAKSIDDLPPELVTKYWGSMWIPNVEHFKVLTINVDYPDFPPIVVQQRVALQLRTPHRAAWPLPPPFRWTARPSPAGPTRPTAASTRRCRPAPWA